MTFNLSPWEGRLALLFALALPLAFSVGCEDPIGGDDDDAVQDDDDDAEDFSATIHVVVPYGWVGGVNLDGERIHTDVAECDLEVNEPGSYEVNVTGHYLTATEWTCNSQLLVIEDDDSGKTFVMDSVWEGEGICSLTPDGLYGTFNVSSGAGVIGIGTWDPAVATGDTFFVDTRTEDSGTLLEGEIANDLSWIYYHRLGWNGNESEATLPLMDE